MRGEQLEFNFMEDAEQGLRELVQRQRATLDIMDQEVAYLRNLCSRVYEDATKVKEDPSVLEELRRVAMEVAWSRNK